MTKKYLILPNKADLILDLNEGLNKVTGTQLNMLLHASHLMECMSEDLSYSIGVSVVVRSTHTNEIIVWEDNKLCLKRGVEEDPRDLAGYFLVVSNVQAMLMQKLVIPMDTIRTSVLQPIGVIKQGNRLDILFHLILQDKFLNTLTLVGTEKQPVYEKIEVVKNFTNLSEYTKMVIPTLKIVSKQGDVNVENQSNREQEL